MECPEMIHEKQELSFDNFKEDLFESLPDFIKEKIQTSQEYQSLNNESNNDLPF